MRKSGCSSKFYEIKVFDDNSQLTNDVYEKYFSSMIVNTEQLYADIFVGNHLSTTFLSDVKALTGFFTNTSNFYAINRFSQTVIYREGKYERARRCIAILV